MGLQMPLEVEFVGKRKERRSWILVHKRQAASRAQKKISEELDGKNSHAGD